MHFWCTLESPLVPLAQYMHTEVKVDARGYAAAARAHIACSGPRYALLGTCVVRVKSTNDIVNGKPGRKFEVSTELKSKEIL